MEIQDGVLYSDRITVNFNSRIFSGREAQVDLSPNQIDTTYSNLINSIQTISNRYDSLSFIKQIPSAEWGDVVRTHRRTGEPVIIEDLSQLFSIKFNQMVPIDSIISELESVPVVVYAHQPIQIQNCADPNDSLYQDGSQWSLHKVQADSAWDITQGDSLIKIAFLEHTGIDSGHPDLNDKWVGGVSSTDDGDYGHGMAVAGMAAAETDNNIHVASLGWKLSIMGYNWDFNQNNEAVITLPSKITQAINDSADIINCSFETMLFNEDEDYVCPHDYQRVRSAINNAISIGVIVVASYGNTHESRCQNHQIPYDTYPAWYPSVIGVGSTDSLDYINVNNNYGDSLDIVAPGINIQILKEENGYYGTSTTSGSSFSAAMVSALCGLMLSMSDDIPVKQLLSIIASTTDTVGFYTYGDDGWNSRYGYGRINAYQTLKLIDDVPSVPTGMSISGSTGQHPTITWNSNPEADIELYKVYRKRTGLDANYVYRSSVFPPDTSYTDSQITISTGKGADYVYYKVKAMDIIVQTSPYSDSVQTKGVPPESKILINSPLPSEFMLHEIYPNPFNPIANIRYDLPVDSHVRIAVYNVLGKEIIVIKNNNVASGYHKISWNGVDQYSKPVSSGVYLMQFVAESINSNSTYKRNIKLMFLK